MRKKAVIIGAAGRDFHNFNVVFRNRSDYEVVAFTAAQIPNIAGRTYPRELAGDLYPDGIPIRPEMELEDLIRRQSVDEVFFSYSDVSNQDVMTIASIANAAGATFSLLGARATMLASPKPVISVCAVRTGCGKSQTARAIADTLAARGKRAAVIRHPMPYGDLVAQRCQRFETMADLDRYECTIEEREEYELHIGKGHLLYAGVDYESILREAVSRADVILWDGGNNDLPFYRPDFHLVLVDPLRPGHERTYYPSQANVRLADAVMVAKVGRATAPAIAAVEASVRELNPKAKLFRADSVVDVDHPSLVRGKRVVVIEDGPTLTHGGMAYGAGTVAAEHFGAAEIVDPRPFAVGSLKATFDRFPHLGRALPAMGYGPEQVRELETTLERTPCDSVLVGTPFDIRHVLRTRHPLVRVSYELDAEAKRTLGELLAGLSGAKQG